MPRGREMVSGAPASENRSMRPVMDLASRLAMLLALSSSLTCGGSMHRSIEGIDGDAFKVSVEEGFPTAAEST
jgi:hypothetical protein